jgi:hypothetical protein
MPFRSTARRLLLAAVVCAALVVGLSPVAAPGSEASVDASPAITTTPTVVDVVEDAPAPPRPVVVRRIVALATLLAVAALVVAGAVRRVAAQPSPRRLRASAGHLVRGLRAPPLSLPC